MLKLPYGPRLPFTQRRLPQWRTPQPGEIVAFHSPVEPGEIYLKRVIAGAGDIVAQQEIPKLGIIHVRKGDKIPGIAQARVVGHKIEGKSTFRRRKSFRSQRR